MVALFRDSVIVTLSDPFPRTHNMMLSPELSTRAIGAVVAYHQAPWRFVTSSETNELLNDAIYRAFQEAAENNAPYRIRRVE